MRRFFKSFRHGEKGFTLIELLVVVAILGILAAIVIPNVSRFMGSGKVEGANTEAHDVQLAVIAYMADSGASTYGGTIDNTGANPAGPEDYLLNTASLQATYTVVGGEITGASPNDPGKWSDLVWNVTLRTWEKPAA
jgi:type IV pilus assembly protein PilA